MSRYFASWAGRAVITLVVIIGGTGMALAQMPTGTISGHVVDVQTAAIPGVSVTLESTSLQVPQKASTTANGDYIFKFLPPGDYRVVFALPGFATSAATLRVAAGEPVTVDSMMRVAQITETVSVQADSSSFISTSQAAANITADTVSTLPTNRSLLAYVNLAPAVHQTGPGAKPSIAGAMSFENLYMINGVVIQDNVRRSPNSLYIEDAIQETTITTSGISADLGRFTGGVVNAVTKSGGNALSGSYRTGFANDNWRAVSPFGEPKLDKTIPTYEFTVGGPAVRDRLWYFGAGRVFRSEDAQQTAATELAYNRVVDEKRFEGKVTQALGATQRVEVGYISIGRRETNNAYPDAGSVMDFASLTTRELPQSLVTAHYTGTLGSRFFLEGQYSSRLFRFKHDGGLFTDRIKGTPLMDQSTGAWWSAPNFCGVCADEQRNNDQFSVKASTFLSTGRGSHNVVFGYDTYNDRTKGDVHQSASDYHVWTTASFVEGGTIYPVIEPGFSTFIIHWPLAQSSRGTNFRTHGLFVSDSWKANARLTLDLGMRFDKNSGKDASGALVASDSIASPRLGMVWDPTGRGTMNVTASYSRYVSSIANTIASQGSGAGLTSILGYFYDGPPINLDPSHGLVTTDQALQEVFSWYDAARPDPFQVTIPGVQTQIRGSLKSPHADELAVGFSRQLGARGDVRVDLVKRKYADFYAKRTDASTGHVEDAFGQVFDLALVENTNQLERNYWGVNALGSYRLGTRAVFGASYTLSRLRGNVEGEDNTAGPIASDVLMYPEFVQSSWNTPIGDLSSDQRHRARVWGTFMIPAGGDANALSVSVLQQMESGTPYGASAAVSLLDDHGQPYVDFADYATPPMTSVYHFTARDAFHTAASYRTDMSFNYARKLGSPRRLEVFVNAQVFNIFNQARLSNRTSGQISRRVLTAANSSRFAAFNPFTETPVKGVNWDYSTSFGKPTSAEAYTQPRTFRFSLGMKF